MILNGVIDGVEVQRSAALVPVEGLDLDLRFTDIKDAGENIEAAFVYEAHYLKDAGYLRMTGRLLVRAASAEKKADVMEGWASQKAMPAEFAEEVTNAAHYLCTINSPLATRIVDLAPPIAPMAVSFSQGRADAKPAKKPKK